jgi:ABC-type transport system involved in Fe-S cluster assembly fused permease/ATPase subunit
MFMLYCLLGCAGEWARAVAMVSQEPVLFSGSIGDNIAYGKFGRCRQEEIQAAAEAANAHEFIMELPDGYNTLVGDRGTLLSGEGEGCQVVPYVTRHRSCHITCHAMHQ